MVIHYKCSNCGSDMTFDGKVGNLYCKSCGNVEEIDKIIDGPEGTAEGSGEYKLEDEDKALAEESFDNDYKDNLIDDAQTDYNTFEDEQVNQYQCENCGATLITDSLTTATSCNFCGASVVLGERLKGDLAPSKVIPFKITKDAAQDAFKKWCKNGRLTPRGFMNADRISSITGLYVPFWLFDLNGKGEATALCTRVRTYTSGDYIYTETKYYNVYRKVDLDYSKVPVDASKKMDDSLMDKLEPFPHTDLKQFNMPYLAGYLAEKYDFNDGDLLPRVKSRVNKYLNDYIRSTINGYNSVSIREKDLNIRQTNAEYTLMPVWMVSYDYKNENYMFAMNGQTGKIVGKPPIDKTKVILWFSGVSAISFTILKLTTWLIGGVL